LPIIIIDGLNNFNFEELVKKFNQINCKFKERLTSKWWINRILKEKEKLMTKIKNGVLIFSSIFPQISPKNHRLEQSQNHDLFFFSFLFHKKPTFFLNSHSVKKFSGFGTQVCNPTQSDIPLFGYSAEAGTGHMS
jgi:hypothetical protein